MSWAVAVCIDLTCVMAARERQRDKQQGVVTRRLSWPTAVLAGGILLSLAANLARAQPTAWGRIVAAVPPAAFLVAVSMIERRAARRPRPVAGRDGGARRPRRDGRPRCAMPGTRPGTGRTRRCSRSRGGPPPSTRASTASRSPATRCAPGSASPTRPPPSCCASSAPARAAAGNLPRRLTPAASPRRPAPLVRGGQAGCGAVCPRGSGARRAAWRGRGSTGTAKAWQPTGTGSPAPGRPARGQHPLARSATGPPLPARRATGQVRGGGRSAEIADRLSGFANLSPCPHRQLIRVPIRVPAESGAPFQGRTCRTRRNKPSGGLPDCIRCMLLKHL